MHISCHNAFFFKVLLLLAGIRWSNNARFCDTWYINNSSLSISCGLFNSSCELFNSLFGKLDSLNSSMRDTKIRGTIITVANGNLSVSLPDSIIFQ